MAIVVSCKNTSKWAFLHYTTSMKLIRVSYIMMLLQTKLIHPLISELQWAANPRRSLAKEDVLGRHLETHLTLSSLTKTHGWPPIWRYRPTWASDLWHLCRALWWWHPPSQVLDMPSHLLFWLPYPTFKQGTSPPSHHPMPQLPVWHTPPRNWHWWTSEQLLHCQCAGDFQKHWTIKVLNKLSGM